MAEDWPHFHGEDPAIRNKWALFLFFAYMLQLAGLLGELKRGDEKCYCKTWPQSNSDFARRTKRIEQGIRPDSKFYNMEREATKNYDKYNKQFERTGKYKGVSPGIDW